MRASTAGIVIAAVSGVLCSGLLILSIGPAERSDPSVDARRQVRSGPISTSSPSPASMRGAVLTDPEEAGGRESPSPASPEVPAPDVELGGRDELGFLRSEFARLQRELELCHEPEGTPLGQFVRLASYRDFTPEERARVRAALEAVPVVLTPAEADWLARHENELCPPGKDYLTALVAFLGPSRVATECRNDPSRMAVLRTTFPGDQLREVFGGLLVP